MPSQEESCLIIFLDKFSISFFFLFICIICIILFLHIYVAAMAKLFMKKVKFVVFVCEDGYSVIRLSLKFYDTLMKFCFSQCLERWCEGWTELEEEIV